LLTYRPAHRHHTQQRPDILFNYLGQFDTDLTDPFFALAPEGAPHSQHQDESLTHGLQLLGIIAQGRLRITVIYDRHRFPDNDIASFCQTYQHTLTQLIDHCRHKTERQLTPSDLAYKGLSIPQLHLLQQEYHQQSAGKIVNIYPLTPTQEGILFHHLADERSSAYLYQETYSLSGADIDPFHIQLAIDQLAARHEMLRCSIDIDHFGQFFAVILDKRSIAIRYEDLTDLSSSSIDSHIKDFTDTDHQTRFDLRRDPLLRLALFKIADRQYRLVWSSHHIILDGWCMSILLSEFTALYTAIANGTSPGLNPAPSYLQFIRWLDEHRPEAGLEYWKQYLSGYDTKTLFPSLPQHDGAQPYQQGFITFNCSAEETIGLEKLAADTQVTLNTLIQTAWGLIVSFYSQSNDIVFGSVVAGRPAAVSGIESMVGLFINTVPVRFRFEDQQSIRTIMQQAQQHMLDGENFHQCSLARIQQRSNAGQDLVNHTLEFANYPGVEEAVMGGLQLTKLTTREHTNYPLGLTVQPGQRLAVRFQFNKNYYTTKTIALLAAKLRHLLQQFLHDPWITVRGLDFTPTAERNTLLGMAKGAIRPFASTDDVIQLFRRQVRQQPASIAVRDQQQSLTYAQLDDWSSFLCQQIARHSLPGKVIAVHLDRGAALIAALIGVWKAGCTYLPIDPHLPQGRIAYMLKDASASCILASAHQPYSFEAANLILIETIFGQLTLTGDIGRQPLTSNTGPIPAYLIYTSGSTGRPKGVIVHHAGMVNHLHSRVQRFALAPGSNVAQTASQSFDISIWQMLAPLIAGATVTVYDADAVLEPRQLLQNIARDGITVVDIVPTYLSVLLDVAETEFADLQLTGLHSMATIGEELKPALVHRWQKRFPHVQLFNTYGPSEASDTVTDYTIPAGFKGPMVPIGRPIPNTRVYIVDKKNRLCPPGMIGELWIAGIAVGGGYVGLPEKTTMSFIPDPFFEGKDQVYITGDRARWDEDGLLYFHGRNDHQVKVRGHRIELGEIERTLQRVPGISIAAVTCDAENGGSQLKAYIRWKPGEQSPQPALLSQLRQYLPEPMIPATIVELDEFPLTPSGKIDRKALAFLYQQPPAAAAPEAHQWSPTEALLAGLWSEILGSSRPDIHADFFQMAGDSIRAIHLSIKTHQKGYSLSIEDIFSFPRLRDMAARLKPVPAGTRQSVNGNSAKASPWQEELRSATTSAPKYSMEIESEGPALVQQLEKSIREADCFLLHLAASPDGLVCRQLPQPSETSLPVLVHDAEKKTLSLSVSAEVADSHTMLLLLREGTEPKDLRLNPTDPDFIGWLEKRQRSIRRTRLAREHAYLQRLILSLQHSLPTLDPASQKVSLHIPVSTAPLTLDCNDLALAAFAMAIRECKGIRQLPVMITTDYRHEGHRNATGCFFHRFPILLHLAGMSDPAALLKSIQACLRALPDQGENCDPRLVSRLHPENNYPDWLITPFFAFRRESAFSQSLPACVQGLSSNLPQEYGVGVSFSMQWIARRLVIQLEIHDDGYCASLMTGFEQAFHSAWNLLTNLSKQESQMSPIAAHPAVDGISVDDFQTITEYLNE
ncbi:MAG TPA: amino acid adenylation domain-containing protein, partial [Puia sp.]|uniref:non-ribosomal peptide synthetase n=1 Tax=Puia sp. TaxID=2045100 RepID=UPI002CC23E8C